MDSPDVLRRRSIFCGSTAATSERPLEERRELLEALLAKAAAPLVFSRALTGPLAKTLTRARRQGLEGVIAKRKGSPYVSGGAGAWWKLNFEKSRKSRSPAMYRASTPTTK